MPPCKHACTVTCTCRDDGPKTKRIHASYLLDSWRHKKGDTMWKLQIFVNVLQWCLQPSSYKTSDSALANCCYNNYVHLIKITVPKQVPSVLWRCQLGSRKGTRPVKNWVVGCWHGYLSGVRCRLAYGPADATAAHCLLLQKNPDWFYLSGTGLPR